MPTLSRSLTYTDAVFIGLAAMLGAGVFAVLSPAVAAAGSLVWLSLLIAALIAYCNAVSSAQLAAHHPQPAVLICTRANGFTRRRALSPEPVLSQARAPVAPPWR